MAGSSFAVVRGKSARLTKTNKCGRPLEGEENYAVTKGLVTISLTPVLKDAEELEQNNMDGEVCAQDRTAPSIKWWEVSVEFCQVNTCLWTMLGGWAPVLNYAGDAVGFETSRKVITDAGVVMELWTGTYQESSCDVPESDAVFEEVSGTGEKFGYLLFGVKEWILNGGIEIGAQVSTFSFQGITMDISEWGRGPYNVVAIDGSNTPGRLLTPVGQSADGTSDIHMEETPIAPPAPTDGCCTLLVQSIFTDPDFYYGGPADEPAADVAPDQPACDSVVPS